MRPAERCSTSVMGYIRRRWRRAIPVSVVFISLNLYFLLLTGTVCRQQTACLLYVDFLLLVTLLSLAAADYHRWRQAEKQKRQLLALDEVILDMLPDFENRDIAEHDVQVFRRRQQALFDENCQMQDYVARWSHEWKLPLAACLLMQKRIPDPELKEAMGEQLERMRRQVDSMLLGCKLQSALLDLQVKGVSLKECVRTSIHNQQFFLIRKHFALDIRVSGEKVYTDPAWLVYILDQLIANAIKYGRKEGRSGDPVLKIWDQGEGETVRLYVEDQGEGIRDSDIRRIFEKGFTGSSCHNGRYRSTGMGLYMADKIAGKLGHRLLVESRYGEYTRFSLVLPRAPALQGM